MLTLPEWQESALWPQPPTEANSEIRQGVQGGVAKSSDRLAVETQGVKQNWRKWEKTVSYLLLFSKSPEQTLLLQYNVLSVKHENDCFIVQYSVLGCKGTAPFSRPHRVLHIEAEITLPSPLHFSSCLLLATKNKTLFKRQEKWRTSSSTW